MLETMTSEITSRGHMGFSDDNNGTLISDNNEKLNFVHPPCLFVLGFTEEPESCTLQLDLE